MKNKIHYTAEALRDLDEVWDYIGINLNSPNAADRIVNRIINDIDLLKDYTAIGVELSEVTGLESDYRYIISGKYIIFYRFYQDVIMIDRIVHSRREHIQKLFSENVD